MEDTNKKSNVKYSRIFYYFWKETKGYRGPILVSILIVLVTTLIGSIFQPIIYKNLIDYISVSSSGFWTAELRNMFALLLVFLAASSIGMRIVEYLNSYTQSNISKKMSDFAFSKTINHSRRFYANNPVGSIMGKTGRFVGSFSTIFDIFVFNFTFFWVFRIFDVDFLVEYFHHFFGVRKCGR